MAFARPTPAQLRDRIAAEFDVLFQGADPRRRRSVEGVLTRVLAIVSHELHGHIDWSSRQMHIATCDLAELEIRAAVWGITRNPAIAATGSVTMLGVPGVIVPAGAELRRADDTRYVLTADATIGGGGSVAADVRARVAGAAGNAVSGSVLALIEPVAGVQTAAAVAAGGIRRGLDIEDLASLRARTLARIQEPPAGGAAGDYRAWVREVVGNTLVWVQPHTPGPGQVTVLFVMPDGTIPDGPTVALVADAIERKRPVGALAVTVLAPVVELVAFSIGLSPDTLANRQAVTAELDDLLAREAVPGGALPHSRIRAAISAAAGEFSHTLTVPAGDIVMPAGRIARRGVVTWL